MIVLVILLGLLISAAIAIVEALIVKWLMPFTGIPYTPDFFQAFFLCLIINVILSLSSSTQISVK